VVVLRRGSERIEGVNSSVSLPFEHGIIHETTAGYTPQSNSAAERLNRTLLDRAHAMLAALSNELWAYAVLAAAYIRNRSQSRGCLALRMKVSLGLNHLLCICVFLVRRACACAC
jgi:transposase InsO family protein